MRPEAYSNEERIRNIKELISRIIAAHQRNTELKEERNVESQWDLGSDMTLGYTEVNERLQSIGLAEDRQKVQSVYLQYVGDPTQPRTFQCRIRIEVSSEGYISLELQFGPKFVMEISREFYFQIEWNTKDGVRDANVMREQSRGSYLGLSPRGSAMYEGNRTLDGVLDLILAKG